MFWKKITLILTALLLPCWFTATAAEEPSIDLSLVYQIPSSSGDVNKILQEGGVSSFDSSDINSSSTYGIFVPMSASGLESGTRIVDFDFIIEADDLNFSDNILLTPLNVYRDYDEGAYSDTAGIYLGNYSQYQFQSSKTPMYYGYIKSIKSTSDVSTFFTVSVTVLCIPSRINNLFFEFDFNAIKKSGVNYKVHATSPVYVHMDDTTIEDFRESVEESLGDVNSNLGSVVSGLNSAVDTITQGNQGVVTSVDEVKQLLDEFKEDYPEMTEQATENGTQSFYDKLKEDTMNVANDTVASIQEQLNIDISGLQNSMDVLMSAISTHDSNPVLKFPAGVVPIKGQQFKLWEETDIDFSIVLDEPAIKLILIAFRFVIYFGFAKYLLWFVKRIESIVTMEGD